jgi:hypothetical protein
MKLAAQYKVSLILYHPQFLSQERLEADHDGVTVTSFMEETALPRISFQADFSVSFSFGI